MNEDFAAAMRRATTLTRALDLTAATQVIQEALGAQMAPACAGDQQSGITPPAPKRVLRPRLIDPSAEIVEAAPEPNVPPPPHHFGGNTGAGDLQAPPPLRRSLGEVVRLLREGRQKMTALDPSVMLKRVPRRSPSPPPLPEGAQFLTRSFTCAAGTRRYKLYIPASVPDRPRGLVLMLHGCKQDPDDFAVGTRMNALAEAHGLLVAYPAQTGTANASSCWNWFNPADQMRSAGEPSILAGITADLMDEFGLDRQQVFAAGLSAGGAMAAVMGETYPDLYAAIGIHSGLAYGSAQDVASAFAAMRGDPNPLLHAAPRTADEPAPFVRAIVFQGSMDSTVHPSNAERIVLSASRHLASDDEPERSRGIDGRQYAHSVTVGPDGHPAVEFWLVEGAGHAWSGGHPDGSYTDPIGPDASREMIRFFLKSVRDNH